MYFRIGASRVHIAGTMHWVPPGRPLADWVLPAYQLSNAVYLEHEKAPEEERFTHFADGQSMEHRLPQPIWAYIKAAWPSTAPPLTSQRPLVIAKTIVSATVAPGVEPTLIARAQADSRRLLYLETFEESEALLEGVSDSCWADYFVSLFRSLGEVPAQFEHMYQLWIAGDAHATGLISTYSHVPQLRHAMFVARNRLWLPRILNLLTSPAPTLVLVGAGHLGGPDGLLALLNHAGHTTTKAKPCE